MKMKTIAIPLLSLIFILDSCNQPEILPTEEKSEDPIEITNEEDPYGGRYGEELDYQPFDIDFEIGEGNVDMLTVNVNIYDGSFILSHNNDGDFSGQFMISLEENEHISLVPSVTEVPAPIEEAYVWADNEKVKKLIGNTRCKQKLLIMSEEDFEVNGQVTFTVEPNCNFFVTDFIISRSSGEMEVKKIETKIDNTAINKVE